MSSYQMSCFTWIHNFSAFVCRSCNSGEKVKHFDTTMPLMPPTPGVLLPPAGA